MKRNNTSLPLALSQQPVSDAARRIEQRNPFSTCTTPAKTQQNDTFVASRLFTQAPTEKDVMKETFAKAALPAEVEVYPAMHGWCPPDSGVYSEPQAEKAWSRLLALYGKALA